jgi:TolA-binding protein
MYRGLFRVGWALLIGVLPGMGSAAEDCDDLPPLVTSQFSEVSSLPSRLTIFNRHDDAARATYTCCRPDQKAEIERALRANEEFLTLYPGSDYADDALMHNARIYSVSRNFRQETEAYLRLAAEYPDSDLADDALWKLSRMYCQDSARQAEIEVLNRLWRNYPRCNYADDALFELAKELKEMRDEPGALAALQQLVQAYPVSDFCDDALYQIAEQYQKLGNYRAAIDAFATLQRMYPASDYRDDAQFQIGNCFRSLGEMRMAEGVYEQLIHEMAGSPFVRSAAQEVNNLRPGRYNLQEIIPSDVVQDAYNQAMHFVRFREYAAAIPRLKAFVRDFPGSDLCDDAIFNIGVCYRQMNELLSKVNAAHGPEEVFRLAPEWQAATGSRRPPPIGRNLQTGDDAVSVFEFIITRLVGSDLRDDAMYQIAACYEDIKNDLFMAKSFQQLLSLFPGSPFETEALAKMMKVFADPANYEQVAEGYG